MVGQVYTMDKGEEVRELIAPANFLDQDTCAVDRIIFKGPVSTVNKRHRTFTEIFLHVSGSGYVFLNDQKFLLSNNNAIVVDKSVRHRFVVNDELTIFSICLPFFDKNDLIYDD